MFFRAITRSFWVLYDNLFKGILMNVIIFFMCFIPFFFMWQAKLYVQTGLLIGMLWYMLAPCVMYYYAKVIRDSERKGMWHELFEGFKLFWWRGIAAFAMVVVMAFLAYIAFVFYKSHARNIFALIGGGISIWCAFSFLLMQIYMLPIMVLDEKRRVLASVKKSLIMFLSAPFSSIFLMLVIMYFDILFYPISLRIGGAHLGPIVYITMFPIFLMPFLSLVFIIIIQMNAAILIYEKHNIYPNLKETWEDRDLNNLFRPWEVK
jgi:hypothetical protein